MLAHLRSVLAAGAVLLAGLAALLVSPTGGAAAPGDSTSASAAGASAEPLLWGSDLADPTVVEYHGGYLAVGTGPTLTRVTARGARGPYRPLASPLTTYPSWVLPGELWAPELAKIRDGLWVLYYTAPAAGLPPGGRCIGAATATSASGPFTPYGEVPLVCPPRAGYPPASDELLDREPDLPTSGVIDASVFSDRVSGRSFLLYKTQGLPSTIRMVQLAPDGLSVLPGRHSKMLVRSHQVVENPTMVRQGSHYVLFTSEGWYGGCDYRTTYRISRQRWTWPTGSTNFLGPVITGLCGPGGADVVAPGGGGRVRMFFHGWTCFQTPQPCPRDFRRDRDAALLPVRGLYGLLLDWDRKDRPQLAAYLAPR